MGMEKYAKTIIPTIEANYERYTEDILQTIF